MSYDLQSGSRLISTILRYDTKQTSYKLALIRSINDVVLSYNLTVPIEWGVAIPLRLLAEYWFAYYFPFVDAHAPILQGTRARRDGQLRADISFRPALTAFRTLWETETGVQASPADGFLITAEFRRLQRRHTYSPQLQAAYTLALRKIIDALENPIRYAGPKGKEWGVFGKPQPYHLLASQAIAIPTTQPNEKCLLLENEIWHSFTALSLWIEALCLHEWCLFTEQVIQSNGSTIRRGIIYELLTTRPDNRRPLTWERNQVDILLMEGQGFQCPWTLRAITHATPYDLDHIIPLAVYPMNELWNLVPADPQSNQHLKRDKLPSFARLQTAQKALAHTYKVYSRSGALGDVLLQDTTLRFGQLTTASTPFAELLTHAVTAFVQRVAAARNLATF